MPKISLFIRTKEGMGLLILAFFHILAAYFSFGFHHPDEHFQILEFANFWVGLVPDASKLPWEYAAQIRPWFQPMIHGSAMKLALMLNCYNPFTMAFLFRLLYSGLNIWGMWMLWGEFKKKFTLNPIWFLWISLIWFFPYIHVRTSSENLCGIFVTFAFVLYLRRKSMLGIGLLFGFAFLARYQVALGVFGFGLYLLWRDRKITKDPFLLVLGFLIPVGIGVLLDRIGYGDWVFTPYRYFKVNLVDGVAATFNPYPWYQYFIWIAQLNPLVSLPLFFGVFFYAKRMKFDSFTAFVLVFFFLHLFITNKEYRFLFPILNLVPFMAAVGFQDFSGMFLSKRNLWVYSFINLVGFSVSSLHGASVETLWAVHMANRYAEPGETWLSNRDYLDQFSKGYYHLKDHHLILFHDGPELASLLAGRPDAKVLIDGQLKDIATQAEIAVVEARHCSVLSSARPAALFKLRTTFPGIDRLAFKAVYECKSSEQ